MGILQPIVLAAPIVFDTITVLDVLTAFWGDESPTAAAFVLSTSTGFEIVRDKRRMSLDAGDADLALRSAVGMGSRDFVGVVLT